MKSSSANWPWHLALFFASMSWGATYPIIDYMVELQNTRGLASADFLAYRFGIASLLVLPLIAMRWKETQDILRRSPIPVAVIGFSSIAGYNLLQFFGQTEINPSVAALVIALEPLLAFLMAWAIGYERPQRWRLLGFFIALMGLTIMTSQGALGKGGQAPEIWPLIAILLAPACWALATVVGKPISHRHPPILIASLSLVLGTIPLLILPILTGSNLTTLPNQPVAFHGTVAFMILGPTVLSIILWYSALKRIGIVALSAYLFLTPVHGVLLSSLFREPPSLIVILGGFIIMTGVIVSNLTPSAPKKDPKIAHC